MNIVNVKTKKTLLIAGPITLLVGIAMFNKAESKHSDKMSKVLMAVGVSSIIIGLYISEKLESKAVQIKN